MSDLTMCINKKCIAKDYCERFTAEASNWQSFAKYGTEDDIDDDGRCTKFWANDKAKVFEILAAPEVDKINFVGYTGSVVIDEPEIYAPYIPKELDF
jgi:hypothetical protein